MLIGIADAANSLGVSRQRVLQMIAEGRLSAERVGNAWVIRESDVARRRVPVGRPMSRAMAHGFLELAAGARPQLAARDVSRLRNHMIRLRDATTGDGDPIALLRSWLPHRAERREMSVANADLPDVVGDERFVRSGISDPIAGMTAVAFAEGYVDEQIAERLFGDYFVVNSQGRGNLIVHVTTFVPPSSPVLTATDLSEYGGEREDRRARELLAEWFEGGDYDKQLIFGRRLQ